MGVMEVDMVVMVLVAVMIVSSVLWGLASACPHLHGGLGGQLRGWQRAHHQVRQGQQASGRCPQREDLLHHRWNG